MVSPGSAMVDPQARVRCNVDTTTVGLAVIVKTSVTITVDTEM